MQIHPQKIRLVIFDWAGTIIDFGSQAPVGAFVEVFRARGIEVSLAEAREPMGMHKRDHLQRMLENPAIRTRWQARFGHDWTTADLDAMYHDLVPLQLTAIDRHCALIPGWLDCAAALRQEGIRVAGSTGYFHAAAQRCLEAAKNQGYIPDANICGDDVPVGRPAPWMVFRLMEQLSIYPPAAVLKIGDTVVDIEEGLNAGCWSVGVTASSSDMGLDLTNYAALSIDERTKRLRAIDQRFREAGAHDVIESLQDVPALLTRIHQRLAAGERP